ncbi:hypothetical protein BJ912DRAFT_1057648 [Pholiota molesta]|nr:hypothetical protein BJ912DRAFT_1057648 [Pholiota molesta]
MDAKDKTLGKRKEREEGDAISHGSTLFVSNLPYSATSVDLQTLFSDIAPVRSAFVVTEQGTGVSKGVGYVSFALKEDAESAYETLSKDGINLVNRKLRVQWADSKPKDKDGESVKKEPKPRPAPRQPRLPHDPLATRTIVVSGLPPSIDAKVLWKKIRKYTGAEKVDWPIKDDSGTEDPSTAHVLFANPGHASDAVAKLHAHVYKGCLLSVTLKKRLDVLSKPVPAPKSKATTDPKGKAASAAAAPSHASRLIVRNIPFNASEQDLRAVFLPYGPIHSVHIPLDEKPAAASGKDPATPTTKETPIAKEEEGAAESSTAAAAAAAYAGARKPRTKGFAFVWMLSRKDAERAIAGCNGMQERAEDEEVDEEAEEEDEDEDMEKEADDKRATERVIAVDWALSKEKWKEEKAKIEEDVDMDNASGSDDDESSEEDSDDDGLGVHSGSEGESDESDSQAGDSENEEPVKPQLPPPETGTTLFIRNIPFDATEDELRTLFRSFGPLRYARITMDPATGRSRGTGFACFWNLEDADRVIQQSDLLRSETTGQTIVPKKNPFSLPSILTPDPSSSLAHSLVLHGRTLDVIRAVTRDVAARGRSTHFLMTYRPTDIISSSYHAQYTALKLDSSEVERRTSSFNARRALLKSNPSLFISKTRLSKLSRAQVASQRRRARRPSRTKPEDEASQPAKARPRAKEEEAEDDDDEAEGEAKKKSKKRFAGRDTGVKQTKIVRQAERVDPLTGKGRSKGYGFVELHRHSDALRVLRWANNNAAVGPLLEAWWTDELAHLLKMERAKAEGERDEARIKRLKEEIANEGRGKKAGKGSLIVEFSIENIEVVQRRAASQKNQQHPADHGGAAKSVDKKHKREKDGRKNHHPKSDESKEPNPNPLGAIIGRKRKERKGGKKGGK